MNRKLVMAAAAALIIGLGWVQPCEAQKGQRNPAYVIESPDILQIEVSGLARKQRQSIQGEHLVRPDGTVSLGLYGSVSISGLSLEQARAAIVKHLAPHAKKRQWDVQVGVASWDNEVFYVITPGKDGQQVERFKLSRGETVASVLERNETAATTGPVWLARPSGEVLKVNWPSMKKQGANYVPEAGDRLYVGCSPTSAETTTPKVGSDPLTEKLDRILDRLEDLDRRIKKIEQKLSDQEMASLPSPSEPEGIAGFIKSVIGIRLIQRYSSNPAERMKKLLETSEDLRQIEEEWKRFWQSDQPSHLKPERVHGGIP